MRFNKMHFKMLIMLTCRRSNESTLIAHQNNFFKVTFYVYQRSIIHFKIFRFHSFLYTFHFYAKFLVYKYFSESFNIDVQTYKNKVLVVA